MTDHGFSALFVPNQGIVLTWINRVSRTLVTYVGSQVSKINDVTNFKQWRHVSTLDNSADFISRSITVKRLTDSEEPLSGAVFQLDTLTTRTAWVQRFISKLRMKIAGKKFSKESEVHSLNSWSSFLTIGELQRGKETWYKISQQSAFQQKLNDIGKH
ncbi:Hypothetical protein CINCED_3A009906 [Cinara cedri]|uniref:Uncharacterized protein n=1 Tax=Cinara cedri TaxID=506608 RepID=A0A5E4MIX6_9HEMI|nr:Hypothetical protein CINCED_3A009906 [Cinara cedri]